MNKAVDPVTFSTAADIKKRMDMIWADRTVRFPGHLCLWQVGKGGALEAKRGRVRSTLNKRARP